MQKETNHTRFLRVSEFAEALSCSRSKAYAMVQAGVIHSVTIAGLLRIPVAELDRLEQQSEGGTAGAQ